MESLNELARERTIAREAPAALTFGEQRGQRAILVARRRRPAKHPIETLPEIGYRRESAVRSGPPLPDDLHSREARITRDVGQLRCLAVNELRPKLDRHG